MNNTLESEILVSVVIVVYDDDRIIRCVESLKKQTFEANRFEVIVVENGGNLKYKELVNKSGYIYKFESIKSMPLARNIGLSSSQGKYILFTDADCVISVNWIEEMYNFFKNNPQINAVGGVIERYEPTTKSEIHGSNLANGQTELQYLQICPLPYVVLANAGFKRKDLIEIGGFDNDLLSGNDVDICWKLGLKGRKFAICKSAVIAHKNRSTASQIFKTYFRYSKYQALLFKKHGKTFGKKWMINTYPVILIGKSFKHPINILTGKDFPWYHLIEAISIFFGHVYGSIIFGTIYI